MEVPTKIIADGRVTIPADIRRVLDLDEGDYVMVSVEPLEEGNS